MYSAKQVDQMVKDWKQEGLSKPDIAVKKANACLGWAYAWGAVGAPCTVAKRKYYMGRSGIAEGDIELIRKNCQVLNGSKSGCDGCKYYPNGEQTRINDCQGFAKRVFAAVGITLKGGGCTSMYNDNSNWAVKGDVKEMPNNAVCCVFRRAYSKAKKKYVMEHMGVHVGGGKVIHCSKNVKEGGIITNGWTHYAIPKGLYEEGSDVIIPPTDTTVKLPVLRKGSKGSYVTLLQTSLLNRGYKLPKYGADGSFGNETLAAVKQFQQDWGLTPDGVVGEETWKMLETTLEKPNTYTVTMKGLTKEEAEEMLKLHPGQMVLEK